MSAATFSHQHTYFGSRSVELTPDYKVGRILRRISHQFLVNFDRLERDSTWSFVKVEIDRFTRHRRTFAEPVATAYWAGSSKSAWLSVSGNVEGLTTGSSPYVRKISNLRGDPLARTTCLPVDEASLVSNGCQAPSVCAGGA